MDKLEILIKGCIGKFRIGTIWNYLSDQAANAVIRWFKERRKRQIWVVTRRCGK